MIKHSFSEEFQDFAESLFVILCEGFKLQDDHQQNDPDLRHRKENHKESNKDNQA